MVDPAKREAFRGALQSMIDDGASEDVINEATAKFKAKYDVPEGPALQPGHDMGDLKMAESPDATAAKSNIFASTIGATGVQADQTGQNPITGRSYSPTSGALAFPMAMDVMGAPARALAAATTDQKMSDPDAFILKSNLEAARANPDHGYSGPFAPPPNFAGSSEIAARSLSDPLSYAGILAKTLSYIPKMFGAAGKSAEILNTQAGRLASEASGVPEDALRAYGNPVERAKMAANYGKEREIGQSLLDRIDNPDQYMPERGIVDASLEKLPPLSVQPAIDAMDAAKGARVAGRLSPEKGAANASVDKYIKFLRGGDVPEDLSQAAQDAGRNVRITQDEAQAIGMTAKDAEKEASQADKALSQARSEQGKAAQQIGAHKKYETDFGWWYDEATQKAREAAAAARAASDEATAKSGVSALSADDLTAAKASAARAELEHAKARAAEAFYNGQPQGDVARMLVKDHGLRGEDLKAALFQGRKRAEEIPTLPDQTVSAKDLRRLRGDLDVPVNWDEEGAQIKNDALKAGRTTMKNQLLQAAEASGDPKYAEAMSSWSNKLDKLEQIKGLLGKTGTTRDKRVEQFINNLFGKNSAYKEHLMTDLDQIFQTDLVGRARYAEKAAALGEGGKPAWLPRHATGASVKAAALLQTIPVAGQIATLGSASPAIAARFTLPTLTKLERGLKAAGVALTPRSASVLAAMKRPISGVQRARLAAVLAAELESQMPANAIPFRMKDAAGLDEKSQYAQQ